MFNVLPLIWQGTVRALLILMLIVMGNVGVFGKSLDATFGMPDIEGKWDSDTKTYSWTLGYSNLMPIFTFSAGELADYEKLEFSFNWTGTATYDNSFRMVFQDSSDTVLGTITFGSAGDKTITFSKHDVTKVIDLSKVAKISIGGAQYDANLGTFSVTIDPLTVKVVGKNVVTFSANDIARGTVSAVTSNGTTINSGDKVDDGTIITFTMTPGSSDYLPYGWMDVNDSNKKLSWGATYETTVNNDINVQADLNVGLYINAYSNDPALGGVKITKGGKEITEHHVTPWPGDHTFTAIKVTDDVTFEGWFDNEECTGAAKSTDNPYTITSDGIGSKNVNLYAKFSYTGNSYTVNYDVPTAFGANPGTNLVTAKVKNKDITVANGVKLPEGSVVVFTAKQYSRNEEQSPVPANRLILTGWKLNSDDTEIKTGIPENGIVWADSEASYEYTVNADVTLHAIYGISYVCIMDAAEHGSAAAKIGSNELHNDSGFRGNSKVTVTATPADGYEFDHWEGELYGADSDPVWTNENWSTENPFTFEAGSTSFGSAWGNDIHVKPVFKEQVVIQTIGKPYCNHVTRPNSEVSGDNYLDITKLNEGPGATISDPVGGGKCVTVASDGGYVYFKFAETYNLYDLVSWKVTDDEDVYNNVAMVAFYNKGEMKIECYTDAGNRTSIETSVKEKLKAVDEIRIYFKNNTSTTFNWIRFSIEHAARTLPTLKDGTEEEMEIYETTSLVLSNSPGYWRQFPDGTSETVKTDGLIPTDEWKSYYKLDNMQQGDYYFGARDGGPCALGYNHQTELVRVHVNVKALDIYGDIVTTQGSSDKKSESTSGSNYNFVYGKTVSEANVTINVNKTHNDFDSCNGIKINKDWGTELIVNAPNGFRVQKVEYTLGESHAFDVSFNYGNIVAGSGTNITWVNSTTSDNVRMVINGSATGEAQEIHVTNVKVYLVPVNMKIIDESRDITVDGQARKYWLYVPENVKNGTHANVPVVFALHGGGEDYEPTHSGQLNFNSLAATHNFIVVYPRAAEHYFYHFNGSLARAWEATGAENNDTKLFEAIIEALKSNADGFTINDQKIYMAGFSVGGMMAYATANVLSDKFAAFASIAGLPMNEVHQRTHGDRPVPFLHVHGTKDSFVRYEHMATIVDNMLTRNGLSYTPTATAEGEADIWSDTGKTHYKKYAYGDEDDKSATPYIYYQIGTGMTASDTGMGHNHWCNIGGKDVKQVMWEFFSGRTLPTKPTQQSYFKAQIKLAKPQDPDATTKEAGNQLARDHGWNVPTQGSSYGGTRLVAQYGESGGYSTTDENVYHTIQLPEGTHYLKLKATGGGTQSFINLRVVKLGNVNQYFDKLPAEYEPGKRDITFPITESVVLDENYDTDYSADASNMCIQFSTTGVGEYRLVITKSGLDDAITIDGISIDNWGTVNGHKHEGKLDTDFGGYYSYNNRLCAQWNFDLTDPFRFNAEKVKASIAGSAGYWSANYDNTNTGTASATMGTVIYTYTGTDLVNTGIDTDLGNYKELTYDGANIVPITAGLKFKADQAGHIRIQVTLSNGRAVGSQLVVDEHVKMYIPYVENSYRPDNGFGGQVNDADDKAKPENYMNCLPHHKRDIIYMSLASGTVWNEWKETYWEHGHVINKCIDDPSQELFHSGGEEFINDKKYYKMNYLGKQGMPCIMQFRDQTTIDRIGVNRNLTYSFYSEYLAELGVNVPQPRTRIVGSPKGLKVANIGDTEGQYGECIAFTFGGWPDDREGYSAYTPYDGHDNTLDRWNELGVYNGSEKFYTWANMPEPTKDDDAPIATDGFPVFSRIDEPAHSETVMDYRSEKTVKVTKPAVLNEDGTVKEPARLETHASYHPVNDGNIIVGEYQANVTPWSLPCRGAYLKFEPSRPGVLNVHILQRAKCVGRDNVIPVDAVKATYYIADEFGRLIDTESVFCKTAMQGEEGIQKIDGGFQIKGEHSDYVKYSFNVYPGKTYYMFSNNAGVGMTGFYYEPDVYRYDNRDAAETAGKDWELGRRDIRMKAVTLEDGVAYTFPSGLTATETLQSPKGNGTFQDYPVEYSEKAVEVTLERSFKADTWNSICLPFSMNQVEMENVFGKGTTVILLRDIQPAYRMPNNHCTLNYIYHENQDIIAGYPYFIKPTKAVEKITANVCLYGEDIDLVSISSEGPLTVPSFNAKNHNNEDVTFTSYDGIHGWTFHGTLTGQDIPLGAYALDGGGGLATWNQVYQLKPYRVLLDVAPGQSAKALPRIEAFGMGLNMLESDDSSDITSIDIDAVLAEQGIFAGGADVYSIDGKKLRTGVNTLQQLPKGIYIINNKKYVVK